MSAGFTGLSANMAAARNMAGASRSSTSTPSPAVSRRSSISPTTCAILSAGSPCLVIAWNWRGRAMSLRACHSHQLLRRWSPAHLVNAAPTFALGESCEFTRAIRDRNYRAIGDPNLVLSGTETANPAVEAIGYVPRNLPNQNSFGILLTPARFSAPADKSPKCRGAAT